VKITRDHVKSITGAIVGTSVTSVVKTIIKSNYAPTNKLQSAELFVTCFALGGMVASKASEHVNGKVDAIADGIAKAQHKINHPEEQD
jgi:hypothetical protein